MTEVNIFIDEIPVKAREGDKILWAALDAGIYIPHMCAIREAKIPLASCRLCFVEIEGYPRPVPSCAETVKEGMKIKTRSPKVDRLVKSAFDLLLSVHRLDCRDCPANKNCVLQDIAKKMRFPLKQKTHRKIEPDMPVDESRADFGFNPNHCVLCGKCVWVCNDKVKCGVFDFAKRGLSMVVSTFDGRPLAEQDSCNGCLECVKACPVGALYMMQEKKNDD
jgi:bidirectional [NiFe] hydrogenase diaphorase subunit